MPANVVVSSLPRGTALSRYLMLKGLGGLGQIDPEGPVWRQVPHVAECLREEFLNTKTAVPPGTTVDAANAGPLAVYGIAGEALALLRDISIIGALEPRMRRVPFKTHVPREIGSGTGGAWIGEGGATPMAATGYDTIAQNMYKVGTLIVLTKELLKVGNPDAERTVRETVMAGLGAFLDAQFLSSAITLIPGVRPAAITNGATAIVSTGTTAAQISADLNAMVGAITTSGGALTWVLRKKTMATVAGALGVASGLPQTLYGLPVVVSDNAPAQITLVDASQILFSDTGGITLDTSEEALLQMDSAPVDPVTAATVMTSLWPLNLWAIKALRWIAYLPARAGAVVYMTVSY